MKNTTTLRYDNYFLTPIHLTKCVLQNFPKNKLLDEILSSVDLPRSKSEDNKTLCFFVLFLSHLLFKNFMQFIDEFYFEHEN